ncbi:efflux transporter outer membrane subunit [Sphaerotilus microaerophilus]|uniref:RND transporter n=1 Tax=Sphaerotilus microaerophilus TaxID=2914710 RepID=A0ABM7YI80_9BURK|nr:efflux transporter outer membrane subunit [Sphaerotilus sp. FB-5]BDI03893.1 RND transporter [Sphaerotilus sp. FB-5]
MSTALLAACASTAPVGTAREAALTPPAAWSAAAAASAGSAASQRPATLDRPALARWWQQFDDPLLTALIDEALQGNTDLAIARARLDQARALRDSQAAGASPQLGSSAGLSRNRSRATGGVNTWQAGLDASWEPDFFGAQSAAQRGRDLDMAASAADLATTRMTVTAEVGIAYATLRGSRTQWRIARDNLAAQEQTLALTRWRAQAGLASTLDAEQARLSTEQLHANLPALEASIAQSEHRLAVLLGQPPAALRERLGSADRLPASTRDLPAGVPAELLRQRPDVRAAELAIQAEAERLGQRQAQRWPRFSLSGSLALKAATLSGLGTAGALVSGVAAAVDWPIWDGGTRRAAIDQQQAVLAQARASYRAAVLAALEDVENALTALGATRAQLRSLGEAQNAAQTALLLARQRYQAGLIDFGTLLDAQRSALSADNSLASARTDERLNLIRLYKALGGGWEDTGPATAAPAGVAPNP